MFWAPLLCKPDILFILDRAHGLHFFEVSSIPIFSWLNRSHLFVENSQQMKPIADLPLSCVGLCRPNRLVLQYLRDINEIPAPLDLTVVSHPPNDHLRVILYWRDLTRIATRRNTIYTAWSFSSQRFMAPLPVILLIKQIKMVLLAFVRCLGWNIVLERSVHPFMTSVLAGLSWLAPLRTDAQLDPPLRQLTDTADGQRGKGRSVIRADRLRQPIFAKRPLKPGPDSGITGVLQGPAQKQIAREVVRSEERRVGKEWKTGGSTYR